MSSTSEINVNYSNYNNILYQLEIQITRIVLQLETDDAAFGVFGCEFDVGVKRNAKTWEFGLEGFTVYAVDGVQDHLSSPQQRYKARHRTLVDPLTGYCLIETVVDKQVQIWGSNYMCKLSNSDLQLVEKIFIQYNMLFRPLLVLPEQQHNPTQHNAASSTPTPASASRSLMLTEERKEEKSKLKTVSKGGDAKVEVSCVLVSYFVSLLTKNISQASLSLVDATLLFVDEYGIPLVQFSLPHLQQQSTSYGPSFTSLTASLDLGINIQYYNQRIVSWEPLVEPWTLQAKYNNTTKEDATQCPTFVVESSDVLNLNVTEEFVENMNKLVALVDTSGEQSHGKYDVSLTPVILLTILFEDQINKKNLS